MPSTHTIDRAGGRDVNSREIAFPGRESQFPGLDQNSQFRPNRYFYVRDRSWIAGGGTRRGRSPARPSAVPGRICTAGPTQWHNYGYRLTAAETSVPSASYHVDTPLSFVSRRWRPCVWYAGHGRCEATSDRLIASAERQVTIIPLTIGLFRAVVSVSILVSREISFPRSKKIEAGGIMFSDCLSMCVRWASVHMSVDAWAQAFLTSSPLTYSF